MPVSEWENFDARLTRLEKENRWLKTGCLSCALAVAALFTLGQARPNVLEAQKIVLRGSAGKVELSAEGNFPYLTISGQGINLVKLTPTGLELSAILQASPTVTGSYTKIHAYYGHRMYLANSDGLVTVEVGGSATSADVAFAEPQIKIFDREGKRPVWHAP